MRIANVHHAWTWPSRARKKMVTLVVITVVASTAATFAGCGRAALTTVIMTTLAGVAERLLRAVLRHQSRAV